VNAPIVRAYIGLGGNLGDVSATLASAFAALDALPQTRLATHSSIYRSPAWGMTDQPAFLNAVAALDTELEPASLLAELLRIERAAGRERIGAMRWGPRTLDLDLLLYADAVIDQPGLHVPHPHLHERAFVLLPLAEIASDAIVPGRGYVADLASAVDADGIEALG
jgi:2-amino-4-hydroxy-6-hydroxymethyldihydropteridine diphosphokinase